MSSESLTLERKRKICFIVTVPITYNCFLKDYAAFLHDTGKYDISLVCRDEPGLRESLPWYIHYYPVQMSRGVSTDALSSIHEIEHIFKEQDFSLVQYSTPNASLYASIAARRAKIPNRLYCQWGIRYMGFQGTGRIIFKMLEKATCRNSSFIEVESHGLREFALKEKLYDPEKSCVVWNGSACGIDLSRYQIEKKADWRAKVRNHLGIANDAVVFQFAGRLTADKGINELLKAYLESDRLCNESHLVISGGMDDEKTIDKTLLSRAMENENVHLTGSVSDIEQYYAACDVFVAPSYREGFGLVVIEAEAMGVPAIVSNVPGQIDAIQPDVTGLTCQVKDVVSLRAAMERLLSDASLRSRMGRAAADFAREQFGQQVLFDHLESKIDEIIGADYA
ncbi:MAG: glycosyltransferase [Coriobacteriaceae bacterium]|nr:glycosyltransferase [Coriobacteriaceae bacterium]